MGPARPCFGDSSRDLGALNKCRDVGPGFPGSWAKGDEWHGGFSARSLTSKSPRGRHLALRCGDPTDSRGCFAGRLLPG